ncbi:TPA: hypothetical protein ACF8SY_001278 [Pseudomonas aeruginosa]|nr:hypothetical protein [Pseudomonas aeruginosa]MCT0411255.1 hypothetical protein [Pseudomonas aeruginosa]
MTEPKICTCPSGDGSLRWPCPKHPAVEQAGGDERAAFEAYRDRRNALLESEGHKPGSKWHVTNAHYPTWEASRAALAQPSPAQAEQAEVKRLREAYEWGYDDGQNNPNGYSDKKERDACVNELLKQPSTVQADAERPTYECTMGVGGGDGNLFVHGDHASIKAAQKIVLERDAALARVAELEMLLRKLSTNGLMQFSTVDEEMAVQAALGGAPVAQAGQVPQAWLDVQAERRRQITAEGWTPEHDDLYCAAELPRAAAAYILNGANDEAPAIWPFVAKWWKPRDARSNYVRAGALILAEIERLDRAAPGKEVGHE